MCFLDLPCQKLCEMMRFYPMLLKICMLKLDTLIEILVEFVFLEFLVDEL